MKNIYHLILCLGLFASCSSQKKISDKTTNPVLTEENTTTTVSLNTGIVLIPGLWEHLNFEKSSGQQYLKNSEGVIIAVAKNPKKAYPFYEKRQTGYETVKAYTKWDLEFQKKNDRETKILKEDSKNEFQIWKFTDDKKIDNVFLYGSAEDNIINLLIYTNSWNEQRKVKFLENTFSRNRN